MALTTYGLPSGFIQEGILVAQKLPDYALPDDTLTLQQMSNHIQNTYLKVQIIQKVIVI